MSEINRVLKPNGKQVVVVPHFSNPYFYSDYTHKRFIGLYTFDHFAEPDSQLQKKVPSYYSQYLFRVVKRKLIFTNSKSYRILNLTRRLLTGVV